MQPITTLPYKGFMFLVNAQKMLSEAVVHILPRREYHVADVTMSLWNILLNSLLLQI